MTRAEIQMKNNWKLIKKQIQNSNKIQSRIKNALRY